MFQVILSEEETSDEERMKIIKSRRQAHARRIKQMKSDKSGVGVATAGTAFTVGGVGAVPLEVIEEDNEDIFNEMNIGK